MAMTLEQWKTSGSYFKFQDRHQIFFQTGGDPSKPCLLLVHGFPSSSFDYLDLWPTFTSQYFVITLDMLGFGFSDKPYWHTYKIAEQADIYAALLKRFNIKRYHLFAHDYGVSVGQELLARQGGPTEPLIESVVFLNGGLFPEQHRPVLVQKLLLLPVVGSLITFFFSRRALERNFKHVFGQRSQPTTSFLDDTWALIRYNWGWSIMHRLIRYIPDRRANRDRWFAALQTDRPLKKLIVGVQDPISGGHMAAHYRSKVPNADITELQDNGHYPQVENPKGVLEAFQDFHRRIASK